MERRRPVEDRRNATTRRAADRRRHPRYGVRTSLRLMEMTSAGPKIFHGRMIDVSQCGARFTTPSEVQPGTRIVVEVLGVEGRWFSTIMQIVRNESPTPPNGSLVAPAPEMYGATFVAPLPANQLARLRELIEAYPPTLIADRVSRT